MLHSQPICTQIYLYLNTENISGTHQALGVYHFRVNQPQCLANHFNLVLRWECVESYCHNPYTHLCNASIQSYFFIIRIICRILIPSFYPSLVSLILVGAQLNPNRHNLKSNTIKFFTKRHSNWHHTHWSSVSELMYCI